MFPIDWEWNVATFLTYGFECCINPLLYLIGDRNKLSFGFIGINDRGYIGTVGTELANFPPIPTNKSLNALAIAAVPVISQKS